jgi:KRAB domain-containing zinc finger protein
VYICTAPLPCDKMFPFHLMVKWHLKTHHAEKTLPCQYCDASFTTKQERTFHQRSHTGEKPYLCDLCPFACSRKGQLEKHKLIRHSQNAEELKKHRCDICAKKFWSAYKLKIHTFSHSDVKRFMCPTCGMALKNDSCYRNHMINVHGNSVRCDKCDKQFFSPKGLQVHKRDQHGEII